MVAERLNLARRVLERLVLTYDGPRQECSLSLALAVATDISLCRPANSCSSLRSAPRSPL